MKATGKTANRSGSSNRRTTTTSSLTVLVLSLAMPASTSSFVVSREPVFGRSPVSSSFSSSRSSRRFSSAAPIVSPFDDSASSASASSSASTATATAPPPPVMDDDTPLDLTWDNVELVLEEMRPYLIQDGGNVAITEIDGPVIRLELQGACGTCPSSTQTMKMGLERRLRERIPEIQEVVQSMPSGPELVADQVEVVLEGVRPFLHVAGGSIELDRLEGVDSVQPTIWLDMQGSSSSLASVKLEIAQRLQRHFMLAGLRVEWVE